MSKIFLHIGMHKTGSTAIQSALSGFDNGRVQYADLGYENHSIPFYTAYSGKHQDYHIWKSAGLNPDQIEQKRQECLDLILKCVASAGDENIVFSGEDISLLPKPALVDISELFKSHGKTATVIAYVREPESFIQSNFQEDVKSGRNDPSPAPPNYRFRVEKFIDVFSSENLIVRVYDRASLHKNDIVQDFCRLIGAASPGSGRNDNSSLSTEAVKVIYLINHLVPAFHKNRSVVQARQKMLEHVRKLLPGRFEIPSHLLSGRIDKDDVDWLYAKTGIDFRQKNGISAPFSQKALDSYLRTPEEKTIEKIKDYLLRSSSPQNLRDEPRFLLPRYFMSFLASVSPAGFEFDPDKYLEINRDVKTAGVDPYLHYLKHGILEGRRLK